VRYITDNPINRRFFNSLGIPGGVTRFDLKDEPDSQNFITYDDGTVFELEQQYESFSGDSGALGMYEANVRYSKAMILSGDIIEVNRVKSVTIQGMEFEVR
jgi:hypothetical protein